MVNSCCAYGCVNRFKSGCRVGFFRFPRNENRRKQWVLAVKRRYWKPTEETRICSEHFQTGKPSSDPNHPDYVPSIFTFKSLKAADGKDKKKKITEKKASLQIQARKRNAVESEGMRRRRLKPSALPSQCLPTSRPLEDEKIKRKKKQNKNSVSKARRIVKAGTIDASSKAQKTPSTDSSSHSVLNYRLIDSHKAPHLPTTNESNNYINISDSSVHFPLLEREIKIEIPWEKEYNFIENFTNENERCDASDQFLQDEVASTSSTLSVEDPENSLLDTSPKKISQEKDSSSENIECRKVSDRNEQKINNSIYSEESMKRKNQELSGSGKYFNIKKLEKCKIGPREETFGRFIACEMSDLSENPVLYLKTKQIILRALIDAHIELTNSYL